MQCVQNRTEQQVVNDVFKSTSEMCLSSVCVVQENYRERGRLRALTHLCCIVIILKKKVVACFLYLLVFITSNFSQMTVVTLLKWLPFFYFLIVLTLPIKTKSDGAYQRTSPIFFLECNAIQWWLNIPQKPVVLYLTLKI